MANKEEHALQYESKLPFMFELLGNQSQGPTVEHGMTSLQAEFWRVVWECKERINSDPKHMRTPTVVREFYLEVEVWGTFWDEKTFPGRYPVPVQSQLRPQPETTIQTASIYEVQRPASSAPNREPFGARTPTSQSYISQTSIPRGPAALSGLLQRLTAYGGPQSLVPSRMQQNMFSQNPLSASTSSQRRPQNFGQQPDVLKPELTTYLRDLARQVIFFKKGYEYVPKHGWDKATGLPVFSILCFARNGFQAFCGEQQQYFHVVKEAFSRFSVMFQKIQRGFMVIWLEARTVEQTVALSTNPELWKAFKECWAFLKSWASQSGDAMNVVMYLENYVGDAEARAEADKLMPPPHPAWL